MGRVDREPNPVSVPDVKGSVQGGQEPDSAELKQQLAKARKEAKQATFNIMRRLEGAREGLGPFCVTIGHESDQDWTVVFVKPEKLICYSPREISIDGVTYQVEYEEIHSVYGALRKGVGPVVYNFSTALKVIYPEEFFNNSNLPPSKSKILEIEVARRRVVSKGADKEEAMRLGFESAEGGRLSPEVVKKIRLDEPPMPSLVFGKERNPYYGDDNAPMVVQYLDNNPFLIERIEASIAEVRKGPQPDLQAALRRAGRVIEAAGKVEELLDKLLGPADQEPDAQK